MAEKHACAKPPTANLGDVWRCPGCGTVWVAIEEIGDMEGAFTWVEDEDAARYREA